MLYSGRLVMIDKLLTRLELLSIKFICVIAPERRHSFCVNNVYFCIISDCDAWRIEWVAQCRRAVEELSTQLTTSCLRYVVIDRNNSDSFSRARIRCMKSGFILRGPDRAGVDYPILCGAMIYADHHRRVGGGRRAALEAAQKYLLSTEGIAGVHNFERALRAKGVR